MENRKKEYIAVFDELGFYAPKKAQELVRCKDCKYFELNHWDNVDSVPLITAHEICKKWGDGCKTSLEGFCFLGGKNEERTDD